MRLHANTRGHTWTHACTGGTTGTDTEHTPTNAVIHGYSATHTNTRGHTPHTDTHTHNNNTHTQTHTRAQASTDTHEHTQTHANT